MNRPVRDPYAGWCVRCTPLATASGAIYTIVPRFLFFSVREVSHTYFQFLDLGLELSELEMCMADTCKSPKYNLDLHTIISIVNG